MEGTVTIFGKIFEYDFLSGWIKYNRMQNNISQEALAHSICSASHLSFFENGKKTLRGDIIEALLKKLNIHSIIDLDDIGLIRQKFHKMMLNVESFDYEIAEEVYEELLNSQNLICTSPYNMEYKIYQLMYNILVERRSLNDLSHDILSLDKIYPTLNEDIQYLYMLITGKLIYDYRDHKDGIDRMLKAHSIKNTPWINYRLGVAYCINNEHLKSTYYLEIALDIYARSGRFKNTLSCHSFLGTCYTVLKLYEKAESHLKATLTGSDYFSMNKNIWGIHTTLSQLYFCKEDYHECIKWSKKAMEATDNSTLPSLEDIKLLKSAWHTNQEPILGACYYIEACIKLNTLEECNEVFKKYLKEEYKSSLYYNFLYSLYLRIFHFEEEIFYKEISENILPYYKNNINLNICKKIKLMLIEYLEKNRKYKEATKIYKELLTDI